MGYKRAIIREAEGANPSTDRIVMRDGSAESIIVCVPDPYAALELSKELSDGGVELIELCGGFGPVWQARVVEAIGGRATVGAIAYGFESLTSVAEYKARFESGEPMSAAFIILGDGSDPAASRTVLEEEGATTTFVAVPNRKMATRVAVGLYEDGVQLIELYGSPGSAAAA